MRRGLAGLVTEQPGRAQILSPSRPRRLGCRLFRSARAPVRRHPLPAMTLRLFFARLASNATPRGSFSAGLYSVLHRLRDHPHFEIIPPTPPSPPQTPPVSHGPA